jgi:23S rRNA (uridine2552-2'-O)-methyltransferase
VKQAGAARGLRVRVKSSAKRSVSSKRWLDRQLNDPYVAAAQRAGWRSRAAFKLIALDERFKLLKKGALVLDLGAAPGGWTQVALSRGASRVVGIDLLAMNPVPGAVLIEGDFMEGGMAARLEAALGGKPGVVLSDMAPNTTGHAATDHLRIMALAELAAGFALDVLAPGGSFVAKVFQGGSEAGMLTMLKRHFVAVKHAKPPASRKDSSELYVVAMGFRGEIDPATQGLA